jgi:hypothetical protein
MNFFGGMGCERCELKFQKHSQSWKEDGGKKMSYGFHVKYLENT